MKRLGLAARLSLFIAISTLAMVLLIGTVAAVFGLQYLRSTVMDNLRQLARDYSDAVRLYVDGARSTLQAEAPSVAELMQENGTTPRGEVLIRRLALRVLSATSAFEFIELIEPSGRVAMLESGASALSLSRPDVTFAEWYNRSLTGSSPLVSDLYISIATRRPSVVIAIPLRNAEGTLVGVWAGGLKLGALSQIAAATDAHGTGGAAYGYVTDSRGFIVAHQAEKRFVEEQTDFRGHPTVDKALRGGRGALRFISPTDSLPKLGAYLPLRMDGLSARGDWTISYVVPEDEALQPVRRAGLGLAGLAAVFGLGLSASSLLIIRRSLNPLADLAAAALAMGQGDLSVRAPPGMRFELANLAGAFNRMASSLADSHGALEERARQLELTNRQMVAANRELEAFSYSVSHDLRAPLRSIDGFSKAILEDYAERLDEQGREYLRVLRSSAQKMGHLIDDMLTLSRVTRGEMNRQEVDLSQIARGITAELSALAPERKADFFIQDGLVTVGDRRLLESALRNLLENAWKFTRLRETTQVEFGSRVKDGAACFFVRDNGVGMDMTYAGKLFQPFQRMHREVDFEGTGVGLATVKRILARHGGRVWAESEVDRGATFYFVVNQGESK